MKGEGETALDKMPSWAAVQLDRSASVIPCNCRRWLHSRAVVSPNGQPMHVPPALDHFRTESS